MTVYFMAIVCPAKLYWPDIDRHNQMYRKGRPYGGARRAISRGRQVINNCSSAILTTCVWTPAYRKNKKWARYKNNKNKKWARYTCAPGTKQTFNYTRVKDRKIVLKRKTVLCNFKYYISQIFVFLTELNLTVKLPFYYKLHFIYSI